MFCCTAQQVSIPALRSDAAPHETRPLLLSLACWHSRVTLFLATGEKGEIQLHIKQVAIFEKEFKSAWQNKLYSYQPSYFWEWAKLDFTMHCGKLMDKDCHSLTEHFHVHISIHLNILSILLSCTRLAPTLEDRCTQHTQVICYYMRLWQIPGLMSLYPASTGVKHTVTNVTVAGLAL